MSWLYIFSKKTIDLKKTAKHTMPATTRIIVIIEIIFGEYAKGHAFPAGRKMIPGQCAV
jgi:hypothetical protein